MEPRERPAPGRPYSAGTIERKQQNTSALREAFWLGKTTGPVVAYVGRLDEQKGMHLVHHALFYALAHDGQFVLIGDVHHHDGINAHFRHLKDHFTTTPTATAAAGVRAAGVRPIWAMCGRRAAPDSGE